MQHLWFKPERDTAQTRQMLHCYSNFSSLGLYHSTYLQTTVPGLLTYKDLRVSMDSSSELNALTLLLHLLELLIHCNYS